MVAHLFHRIAKLISLIALSSFLLTLGSCQFLGLDMFPVTLSREDASVNLRTQMSDLGLSSSFEIKRMQFITSPVTGKGYIFVLAETFGLGSRLLILDQENLDVLYTSSDPSIAYFVGIDEQGYLLSPNNTSSVNRFNLTTFVPVSPVSLSQIVSNGALSFFNSASTHILWYNNITGILSYESFALGVDLSVTPWNRNLAPTIIPNVQLHSLYSEGNSIRLLFADYSNKTTMIVTFSGISALDSAVNPILSDPNIIVATLPSGDDQSGWLTRNGVILLKHENDTRLVRYNGETGRELDSFSLKDTKNIRFGFSPDGKKWLLYDGTNGKLHLLRTWW